MDPGPKTPRELGLCALDPGWADGADAPCLLVRLDAEEAAPEVLGWLAGQPIPVVGVGTPKATRLAAAVDLTVAEDEVPLLLRQIEENPQAASVLVQVLRATGSLNHEAALAVESLAYATLQAGAEFARWLDARGGPRAGQPRPAARDVLRLERAGDRLRITLDAPHNRNALSAAMRDALTEAFRLVAVDPTLTVDVYGNGPSFCAGGDLAEFGTTPDPATAHRVRMLRMPARYLAPHADRYHFHLHGACIGAGIELPAFAGRISAASDVFFQLPEVAMGLIPGAGGCVSIPRRIGRQRTAYLALTNLRIDAAQAFAWGLVDAVEA